LFFALWPDHALQQSLAETTQTVVLAAGGRPVPPENFHLTLAFLGSVPDARISEVAALGANVASQVTQQDRTSDSLNRDPTGALELYRFRFG
jgi:2'-5' RNA ligase